MNAVLQQRAHTFLHPLITLRREDAPPRSFTASQRRLHRVDRVSRQLKVGNDIFVAKE